MGGPKQCLYMNIIYGKIPYKIERGGGGQAILYGHKIVNLMKRLISSLINLE